MNGRKIDGRVVKVSKVTAKNGRSNFGRDSSRRDLERGWDWDIVRDRDRYQDRDRYHKRPRERSSDCSQDRKRGFYRSDDINRGYKSTRDLDGTRSHVLITDKGCDLHGNVKDIEQEPDRKHELQQDRSLKSDSYQDKEAEQRKNQSRSGEKDEDQNCKSLNGSGANDHRSRELSSEFIGLQDNQVEGQLEFSTGRLVELKKKISHMEELIEEKGETVAKLQEKSQSLENALSMVKKLVSHHQTQMTKAK